MRKKYIVSIVFALIAATIFKDVTSSSSQPPTGYAAAPPTYANCASCHNGTAVNAGGGNVDITFSGASNQYQAGAQYTITVTVTDAMRTRFGFELIALNNARAQAGSFTLTNTATTILLPSGSLQYVGHRNANSTRVWSFTWTAPASIPVGNRITFYCSGNGASNSLGDAGDHIYTDSLEIFPGVTCTPPTSVSIAGNTSFCQGSSTTLQASTSCADCSYLWSNGQTTSSISVNTGGTYGLTASNSCGTVTATNVTVTQSPLPGTPTVSGNTSFCTGSSTTLQVSGTCANCSYTWSNTQTGASINVSTAGIYNVTATNSCGTASSANVSVTQNPLPVTPVISGNNSFCQGSSNTLQVSNPCNGCTYTWSNAQTGASVNVSAAGTYRVTATNNCGSVTSTDFTVTQNPLPTTPAIIGNTTFCEGEETTLQIASACGGCNYVWSNNETGTSVNVNTAGTYGVTASNSCGTASATNVLVTQNPLPVTPVITGDTSFCEGSSTALQVSNICGGCTYVWSNSVNATAINATAGGMYHVIASNSCSSVTSTNVSVTENPLPTTPVITGDVAFCPGQSVTLQVSNVCAGCSYEWSNNATTTAITVNNPGTVNVTATNNCGSATSADVVVTVNASTPAPVITGDTVFCTGASTTLQVSNTCAGCSYVWSNGATGSAITVDTAKAYNVSVTSSCGNATSDDITVTETPAVVSPLIAGETSFCTGQSTTLQVANTCNGCSYLWSNNQPGSSVNINTGGIYRVTAYNSCSSVTSGNVAVIENPLPVIPVVNGDTFFCQNGSTTLQIANTCNGCNYQWSNKETGVSSTIGIVGSYQIVASNGCGSVTSADIVVTQKPLPNTPSVSGNTSYCQGGSTTLQVSNACIGCNYVWSNNQTGIAATINAAGSYTVTVSNECGSDTATAIVVVENPLPVKPVVSGETSFCEGTTVTIKVLNTCPGCNYIWSNGPVVDSIVVQQGGVYAVTAANSCGTDSATISITEFSLPVVSITAAGNTLTAQAIGAATYQWYMGGNIITGAISATYNATVTGNYTVEVTTQDGCSSVSAPFSFVTGLSDVSWGTDLRFYPLPAGDYLNIETGFIERLFTYQIFDLTGQLWLQGTMDAVIGRVNVSTLAAGVYLVRINNESSSSGFRIIKQ